MKIMKTSFIILFIVFGYSLSFAAPENKKTESLENHLIPYKKIESIVSATNQKIMTPQTIHIVFPDTSLEKVVRQVLGKPTGDILETDMESIISLNAEGKDIYDLTGLEYAVNMSELNLSNNQISDITPLQYMPGLTQLYIYNNKITDISPIANLTNLVTVSFYTNQISDISALGNLTNLKSLYLGWNYISDIDVLANLTELLDLDFTANLISDISAVANLTNLNTLFLSTNNINDISELQSLTGLSLIDLSWNKISDITPLQNLTNLINLYLSGNKINDINILQNFSAIELLFLKSNQLDNSDLLQLYNLNNMYILNLQDNPGIISGSAVQTLADNLAAMNCEDITWDGTCGVDSNKAVISWVAADTTESGETVTVQATATNSLQSQLKMQINWGDGNISEYSSLQDNASTFEFQHIYSTAGTFDITVTAQNDQNQEIGVSKSVAITITGSSLVEKNENALPEILLWQNYPNPFNPSTTIRYELAKAEHVTLSVYNLTGQNIATLTNEFQSAGTHEIKWTPENLPSGIYFYKLYVGNVVKTRKFILQK